MTQTLSTISDQPVGGAYFTVADRHGVMLCIEGERLWVERVHKSLAQLQEHGGKLTVPVDRR